MNKANIIKTHYQISKHLATLQIADGLLQLKEFINQSQTDEFRVLYDNFENTYSLILKYTLKGVDDPQRPFILNQLIKSLMELNDKVKEQQLELIPSEIYALKKRITGQSKAIVHKLNEVQDDVIFEKELKSLIGGMSSEVESDKMIEYELFINDFFNYVWLLDTFTDEDVQLVKSFFAATNHPWYVKSLIVSALTLGTIRFFNTKKILLLIDILKTGEKQIAERAFVGLMFCLYVHDERLSYYPEIEGELTCFTDGNPRIDNFTRFFLIQVIKAKDTEKFTKRFKEEIMPDIMKHAPEIQDKLDLDNILPNDLEAEKNPDWQKILGDDPDLMNKLEELSKLQMEGTDVFMSTFAMLKNFTFFKQMIHWFVPFYKENPLVKQALESEEEDFRDTFLASLEQSDHMCNSDKYSFCLNVKDMPGAQKKMMLTMFKQELESINEVNDEDAVLNQSLFSQRVITHYIQDIYRFFKLYAGKSDFTDVFLFQLDFHNKIFFKKIFSNTDILVKTADFYFDNGHFDNAVEVYNILIDNNLNTQVVFEKAAYAYQQSGFYEEAIDYYKKAELFESTTWINLKIAFCYTKLNNHKDALFYLHEAERLEPENMKTQLSIANAYLNMGDINTALNYYFKLELLASSNIKVLRPISWCLFVLGRFEEAEKYFDQLINSNQANIYDLMNYAHLLWCTQRSEQAAIYYLKSIRQKDNTFEAFSRSFNEDMKHLKKHGIKQEEIRFMTDYLKLNRQQD